MHWYASENAVSDVCAPVQKVPLCVFAQNESSISHTKTVNDSTLIKIHAIVEDIDFRMHGLDRYKLYPTENIYNFLQLDTMTGKIEIVQWSLDDDKEGSATLNNEDLSLGTGCGTFELYPTYRPGSAFKTITATAALVSGIANENTEVYCGGIYTYYDDYQPGCIMGFVGDVTVRTALRYSCNIYFYDMARQMGKINKFDTTTQKRAIGKTDVLKFTTEVQPIGKQQYMELSKDIFVFSYLCGGINFTDIANLTNENIQNGRLHYIRQKTKKLIKIGIPQEAMLIIEKYSKESKGYLFPILDSKIHKTALQKQNRIHKILGKVNKNLKLLAAQLGVEANLTTYVARHSFASVLKKSGVNIALISEALGHSDLATTQIYLDSFDNEQVDEAMKNLL